MFSQKKIISFVIYLNDMLEWEYAWGIIGTTNILNPMCL